MVDAVANRVARGLAKLGVRHGDRVGVFLPNSLEHCYLWFDINRPVRSGSPAQTPRVT